jgi:hypothetical protein
MCLNETSAYQEEPWNFAPHSAPSPLTE